MKLFMFKNSSGQPDAMLTASVFALAAALAKFIAAGSVLVVAGHSLSVGPCDAMSIGALLGPTFGAYVMRKHTDAKFAGGGDEGAK